MIVRLRAAVRPSSFGKRQYGLDLGHKKLCGYSGILTRRGSVVHDGLIYHTWFGDAYMLVYNVAFFNIFDRLVVENIE